MKRFLIAMAFLLASAFAARAVPAYPFPVTVTQPDGSTVTILLHGDENFHWITNESGDCLEPDGQGYLQKVSRSVVDARAAAAPFLYSQRRSGEGPQAASSISIGEKRFLVVLINFSDKSFTKSRENFDNLINQQGYSDNGGTGSVLDYYTEQSHALLKPTWDVLGPVKVSGKMADYGGNVSNSDKNPDGALAEALKALDSQVDYSIYDNDGDGYVDNVFFFYAGYSEAEGGGADCIWPHSWTLQANYSKLVLDGVRFGSYACASELMGSSGSNMDGIGTFCHEFGHVLGLPDFYDTNYETGGQAEYTPGNFSLMDAGCYNNKSCTPPNLAAMERYLLEWMSEPATLSASGSYTLEPVRENVAYKILSDVKGEFFLLETRDGTGWDKYINYYSPSIPVQGLVVYHVDQSSNRVSGSTRASSLWSYGNNINAFAAHPCYRIIPARESSYRFDRWVYPSGSVTGFVPEPWSGKELELSLKDIAYSGGTVRFTLAGPETSGLGIKIISSPKKFYSVGDVFYFSLSADGETASSVKWYFDGSRTADASVTLLSKGAHTVKAIVGYSDSSVEEIERVIIVQ